MGANSITASMLASVVYSSILDSWILDANGLRSSVPYEKQIELANLLQVGLWVNTPHLIDDAFFTQLAELVRDNLHPSLPAHMEWSNEACWNFAAAFPQSSWCNVIGEKIGFNPGNNRRIYGVFGWYTVRMAAAAAKGWAGRNSSKLNIMACFQAYGPQVATDLYRLQGADLLQWNGSNGAANYNKYIGKPYNVEPNRPIDVTTYGCYGPYHSGAQLANFDANYITYQNSIAISGITKAGPGVVTTSKYHGLVGGQRVNLQSIGGMAQLNGAYATAVNVTLNTFQLSDAVDRSGKSISSDTSLYGDFTGGTIRGLVPGQLDDLFKAADEYATGAPSRKEKALDWLDFDLREGVKKNSVGKPALGSQTLSYQEKNIYPTWNKVFTAHGKKVMQYEGGMEGNYPGTVVCAYLNLPSSYCGATGSIAALLTAYKYDDRFRRLERDWAQNFMMQSQSLYPSWLGIAPGPNQWYLFPGNIFSRPSAFKSWDAAISLGGRQPQ
jgi:hypothetical protein